MLSRRRLPVALLLGAFLCFPSVAQQPGTPSQPQPRELVTGVSVQEQLTGGGAVSFQVSLQKNDFMRVVVEQMGIDVVLALYGPDGNKLLEHDSLNGANGPEVVSWICASPGSYRVEIRSDVSADAGRLAIQLVEHRPAKSGDELRIQAEEFMAEATVAIVELTKESLLVAIEKYRAALPIWERLGDMRSQFDTLDYMGGLLSALGRHAEAEALFERALRIREKVPGLQHFRVANSLSNLAGLYTGQGRYAEAEPLHQRALRIQERVLGPEHPDVADSLTNLAWLYSNQGRYAEAEPLSQRALRIREKVLGPEHPDVAISLTNLAWLCQEQGRYAEAERLSQRVLRIDEKALGPEHPSLATDLNHLATVYLYMGRGRYAEAERLSQRALRIQEKALGPEDPHVATSVSNLALVYTAQGRYAEAEPLSQRALRIAEKVFGPEHPEVAEALNNLAWLYLKQGRYAEAEPLLQRALRIKEKALGPEHPLVTFALDNLAELQFAQGNAEAAQPFFARNLDIIFRRFQYSFTYMSEKERLQFQQDVAADFPIYFSFCTAYAGRMPALTGSMYDVLLWEKGFVGQSIAALRAKIAASGDPEALKLLDQLTALKQQLSALLNNPGPDRTAWQKQVAELKAQADQAEQELVRRSAALQEDKKLERVTWRDVQKALRPGEAAVEMVKFPVFDGKKWTGAQKYVALIVTRQTTTAPALVLLGEAKNLEGEPLRDYQQLVQQQAPPEGGSPPAPTAASSASGAKFYAAFWQPLEKPLAGVKRVYLSPDGVLNQISFAVLSAPGGKSLSDRYDLRLVSSTKDLLRQPRAARSQSAVLVGNPKFEMEDAEQRAAVRGVAPAQPVLLASAAGPGTGLRSRDPLRGALTPLPGTKVEVESVAKLLQASRWLADTYTESQALEEAVKQVRQPRVLHLATHGFFLPDQQVKRQEAGLGVEKTAAIDDPMLRSGLFLAGAERTVVENNPPTDLEDGVLTAYEATQLNLQGTELVVLSACETGLGEVKNGEGVFGLRRALQIAGAESVMMTMWSVPDRETQELMSLFYQKWLAGKDKHQALREAQQAMRAKVKARYGRDLPFYWGAFVLVGR